MPKKPVTACGSTFTCGATATFWPDVEACEAIDY